MHILFLCRGNVGRSQVVEALFKQRNNRHEVRSAGVSVVDRLTGESVHGRLLKDTKGADNVIISLRDKGIDVSENSRTQLDQGLAEWADVIVCMADQDTLPDYLLNSPKLKYWDVADPKGTSLEMHKQTVEKIDGLVEEFISENNL